MLIRIRNKLFVTGCAPPRTAAHFISKILVVGRCATARVFLSVDCSLRNIASTMAETLLERAKGV